MRILLVEDDSGNRAILRTVLEGHGYSVAEAADGTEALRALEAESFAAVITDILMPKMDGYRLCYEIRHHPRLRHLPIIIYTATYTALSDERLSLDLGADRFLRKPATADELIRAVQEILTESSRGAPTVRAGLDDLGAMQQYSQGLVDKLARKNLQLEGQASALRLSEQRSRLVFDAANDATLLIQLYPNGIPGRIIDANEAAAELLGYTQGELLALTVRELEPAEDEASLGDLAARLQTQGRLVFERRLVAKNGRQIPVEISVRSFPSEQGPMAIAAARDITDRKKAEAERSEQEQRLRAILDSLFVFVGLLSLDGTVLEVNRAPLEAAGIRREDVIDKLFYQTFWWSYSPDIQALLKGALARAAQGETVRFDVAIRVAAGREMPVDFAVNPLRDETGVVRQLVASGVDITERKKLEQQFLRAQRMEAIGTLASGIAHDLNNILAPMLMAASLIKAKLNTPRDQAVARIIETGAQRGAAVIRQLLTFSRGSEGPRGAVQVRHLINDMVHLVHETFPRNIEVECNAPGDLWPVKADATQLHQVLMNLCVNARDAMPRGGTLSVTAGNVRLTEAEARLNPLAKPGLYVVVTVADTGEGIPQEIIDRIFDPFFTTKPVGQGTGLGLSTVLAIARNHGGFVTVDSEPGRGTVFKVYLPAAEGAAAETIDILPAAPRGNGEQLLLVDDEEPIREATQHVLEEHGYRVLTATNGEEGVRLFVQHRETVRLVIADMMMPVMGGLDMIRSLRIADDRIQIIATSGLDEISRRDELSALGVTDVLVKPCEPTHLLRTIHRLISGANTSLP
jgi:PAS domain S-box-containing protein